MTDEGTEEAPAPATRRTKRAGTPGAVREPKPPKEKRPKPVRRGPTTLAEMRSPVAYTPPAYGFDPTQYGARCDVCPLRTHLLLHAENSGQPWKPVPGEHYPNAEALIIGEAPGEKEVEQGRPFVGRSGQETMKTLGYFGRARQNLSYTNTLLCRPPDNDLSGFLYRLGRQNKVIEKENVERAKCDMPPRPLIPTPMECCAGRLKREMRAYTKIITLGGLPTKIALGKSAGILDARGEVGSVDVPSEIPGERAHNALCIPTVHPAFVLRSPKWRRVLIADIGRGFRYFYGQLNWKEPKVTIDPSPDVLFAFLSRPEPYFGWDVETDGKEALTANLRCIGVGTASGDEIMVVRFRSVESETKRFYTPWDMERIWTMFAQWFTAPRIVKAGWNSGYYDRIVIEQHFKITPGPILDGILLHKSVESELPHRLGFVGTYWLDAPQWKTDREGRKRSVLPENDEDLALYNAKDVCVTSRLITPLHAAVVQRQQMDVCAVDHRLQAMGAGMHRVGMLVDQKRRIEWDTKLRKELKTQTARVRALVGNETFNPLSNTQLADQLFTTWGLTPVRWTDRGDPAVDDDTFRALIVRPDIRAEKPECVESEIAWKTKGVMTCTCRACSIRTFLLAERKLKKTSKYLGTYVSRWKPLFQEVTLDDGFDEEEEEDEREARLKREMKKFGLALADGRIHANFNAHVAVTGRYSSSGPNFQNIPTKLKDMLIAGPGHVLIGIDADQIELRIAAARWRCARYLEIFARSKIKGILPWDADPHIETMKMIFGPERVLAMEGFPNAKAVKGAGSFKKSRDLAKRVQYGASYGAGSETLWEVITSAENDAGDLIYAHLTLPEVRVMHEAWLNGAREFTQGWEREVATWQKYGFVAEPILGRRRDFLDSDEDKVDRNEIVNFPIQASSGAIIAKAMMAVEEAIPFEKWGPGTGIVNNCHDSITVECPESEAARVTAILMDAMNQRYAVYDIDFTGEAATGRTWKET